MTYKEFLSFFPVVELPVKFDDETLVLFSRENKVLPQEAIVEYLSRWDEIVEDDITEIIPCMQLPQQDEFIGLVYWKAELEKSEFILITLDRDLSLIAKKSIASTSFEGKIIRRSVAMIDEDLIIHIMAGANVEDMEYDPSVSQSFTMEIMTTGDILFSLENE